ncbi:hypothetical protein ACJMK2_020642 [Sinanodonta woodiana]|uniref:Uncharacterized protein n=1 Tax=Sinanodonta woodiana TaxID=1069815 RepID=A0ABD3U0S2_SINWO
MSYRTKVNNLALLRRQLLTMFKGVMPKLQSHDVTRPNGPGMVTNDLEANSFLMFLANGNVSTIEDLDATSIFMV